jgi:methionyl-tRNA synthetase
MGKFFLTTPIYYVNDVPHLGHAYTTILADVIKRYKRLRGLDVFFLTGTDEHGQKIERSAEKQGVTPQQLADRVVERFKELWRELDIDYDRFIRTTDDDHVRGVQAIFARLQERGDIYPGEYEGHYCVSDESFVADSAVDSGDGNKICPDCGRTTTRLTERCYFFRLSAYQERLLQFYDTHPDFVLPKSRMNEVVSFVQMGLRDLSISRSTVRWGVPVPGDEKQTVYVWFDALANYLTAIGYPENEERFRSLWPADVHIMAKDILKFHAVYWPAFLMAAGLEPPRRELIHGWWLKDEKKMSKSIGNVLDPHLLLRHFSADAIRYFLVREASIGADGNFSHEGFINRVNTDLANDWANLVSRTLGMIDKYVANSLPAGAAYGPQEEAIRKEYQVLEARVLELFDAYQFNRGLEEIMAWVNRLNRYIVEVQPWGLAKEEKDRPRLVAVLKTLSRAILSVNVLLSPVIPKAAEKTRRLFNHAGAELGWQDPGETFSVQPAEPLFPRVDPKIFFADVPPEAGIETKKTEEAKMAESSVPSVPADGLIEIDDFRKVQMVVARVETAQKVEKADKLLQITVDIGGETRTLVAGIAQFYRPEDLVGRRVIIVKNLKPAKLRGILSQGMIVAASGPDGRPYVPFLPEDTPLGAILK